MGKKIKLQESFFRYLFLLFVFLFVVHLVYVFFALDINIQLSSIFLDIIFISIFLLAISNLEYAFFMSLILLPVFFMLENITILNQVYNSQSLNSLSFHSVDPRVIGFFMAIFFSWIFIYQKKDISILKIPAIKIILLMVGYFCLSALWSMGQQERYVQIGFYLLLTTLYIVAYISVQNKISFYRLISFLIALSIPAIFMAYFQIFGGLFFEYADMDIHRVSGPFNSPNLLGSFLLVTSALVIILLIVLKRKIYKVYLLIYLFLALPIFFLTFSRSAWIGMIVFLAIFSSQSKRFVLGVLLICTLLFSSMLMFEATRERLNGFSERTMFDSVYARTNIWRMSYKKFQEKPLLGYGTGSFSEVINDAKESAGGTDNPHNDLVFFLIEEGIIGAVLFLSVTLSFYCHLFKTHIKINKNIITPKEKEKYLNTLSLGIISLFIALTIISTVESYYEGNFLHLFIWSLLGAWFALAKRESNQTKNSRELF